MSAGSSTPPTADIRRILFLDFDGVLHPLHEARANPFSYMDNFCRVLREADPHGTMPIVISSTWRILHTLDELRAFFPPDIGARIVDVTPFLLPVNPALRGSRQREIVDWMAAHAPESAWLALDDIALYFDIDCPHLFVIDEDFAQSQIAVEGDFALMDEIEERERLMDLWQSHGLGINLRVAEHLRRRLKEFLDSPAAVADST